MSDTTNINDLLIDPIGGGGISNNINLTANETVINKSNQMPTNVPGINLDESTINQIVNGIQQAGTAGLTQLRSRDIPMNTSTISNDAETQPNYVPPEPKHVDYIHSDDTQASIIERYNYNARKQDTVDDLYNEIQIPLLLSVLYFLFQLPFLRKLLRTYAPFVFSSDGNLNLNGLLLKSALFGGAYYTLDKCTQLFSKF
jgi:hypothetical protein